MVKPEFWSDEDLHKVSLGARLLFIGSWNFADDFGVLLDSNRKLLGEIFPLDDDISERKLNNWKQELINNLMLIPVSDGEASYLIIRTWEKHQKVEHPSTRRWLSKEKQETLVREYIESHEKLPKVSRSKEERESTKGKEESTKTYGEFENVTLSDKERERLTEKLGSEDRAIKAIEILSAYKKSKNRHYDSDYATFHTWVISELEKRENKGNNIKPDPPMQRKPSRCTCGKETNGTILCEECTEKRRQEDEKMFADSEKRRKEIEDLQNKTPKEVREIIKQDLKIMEET